MRRWQTVRQYRSRGVADDAEVQMNAAESRDLLVNRRHLDDMSRLMLEIAVRHGDGVMTVRELRVAMRRAVADAGTIKAAIEALARKRKTRAQQIIWCGMPQRATYLCDSVSLRIIFDGTLR